MSRSYRLRIDSHTRHITPKKHLGQNFLADQNIKRKIIDACGLDPNETVLEIGPGLGAMTEAIAPRVKTLIAIETDAALVKDLSERFHATNVEIIHADFLTYPVEQLPQGLKVIGNLPYYISTPILERVLAHPEHFSTLYATLQYELGLRLKAKVNTKEYGAFTCFARYYADIELLFKIKNTCFTPVPRVDSCFLKFSRHSRLKAADPEQLFRVIHHAFGQRRKTIVNALSRLSPAEELLPLLEKLKIDPKSRAENIRLEDFVRLADMLDKNEKNEGSITT